MSGDDIHMEESSSPSRKRQLIDLVSSTDEDEDEDAEEGDEYGKLFGDGDGDGVIDLVSSEDDSLDPPPVFPAATVAVAVVAVSQDTDQSNTSSNEDESSNRKPAARDSTTVFATNATRAVAVDDHSVSSSDSTVSEESQPRPQLVVKPASTGTGNTLETSSQGCDDAESVPMPAQVPASNTQYPRPVLFLQDNRYQQKCAKIHVSHSYGRPRSSLTYLLVKNNRDLGLFSDFGQSAFSTRDGQISHFTLSVKWNEFVTSHTENQQLYVGDGSVRGRNAETLAKTNKAIPMFYDPKEKNICVYYIGHYVPLPSTVKRYSHPNHCLFMGRQRCLYIELKFERFDQQLASVIQNGD